MAHPSLSDVAAYRAAQRDVSTLAQRDLVDLWRSVNTDDAEQAAEALVETLPALVTGYFVVSATVSADFYDLTRAQAGVRRRFDAVIPDPPDASRAQALARWGVAPLFSADPAPGVALSKIAGGLQRVVADGGRQTVVQSAAADPAKVGWARVTSGGCEFCEMLAGRGAVYGSTTADFLSHDACRCDAVPVFGD